MSALLYGKGYYGSYLEKTQTLQNNLLNAGTEMQYKTK